MPQARRTRWTLVAILALAFALRALYSFGFVDREALLEYDGRDYVELSRNLWQGHGYVIGRYRWFEPRPAQHPPAHHPEVYRPPLVPLWGAALHALPGPWFTWARLFQAGVGTLAVYLAWVLGRSLFTDRTGLVCAAILAVYPYAVYYSGRWSTEMLFGALVLLALCVAWEAMRTGRLRGWPLVGLAAGLASLARPNGLAVLVGLLVWALFAMRGRVRRRIGAGALLVLGAVLVLGPWTVRNWLVAGVPTPATLFGAYNFWLGNNPHMARMYRTTHDVAFREVQRELYAQESASRVQLMEALGIHRPAETARQWREDAWRYLTHHPGEAAYIWLRRGLHYWRPWPNRATTPPALWWLSTLTVSPLLVLGAMGAAGWWRRGRRRAVGLLLVAPVCGMLGALPFVLHLRLRFPTMDLPWAVLAAAGLVLLVRPRRSEAPAAEQGPATETR